jgi:hypothetical protein
MLDNMIYQSHIYESKMMIAKNWISHSVNVEGHRHPRLRFSPDIAIKLAGAIQHFLPSRRDREVPYGMKGGERNGR